ncbi:HD domain-containing phosphohydrolase [Sulfurimonas sp.]|uniref:HD domain-containing phosphohydrolase n=1 Tax=Sulfurimonas sp. TaxID=2022749 RepID=UPI0035624ECA
MNDKKLNILVVDDEPINIQFVVELLYNDYDVSVATSGLTALEVFEKKRPDIVLLDIHMPDVDGFEVARRVYSVESNQEIPIIFFSADDSIDYMEKGFELGAVDYITKPIEAKSFLLKISYWARLVKKSIESKHRQTLLDQYKSIVDSSAIVSKTDTKGVITFVNDKFCEISGYSREELIGKPHSIVRHRDMPSSAFEELWQTIESKKSWSGKVKNRKKNGEAYYVNTIVNPIVDENDNIIEYIALRHDITELEEYKEVLKDELTTTSQNYKENINYMEQYEYAVSSITAILKTDTDNNIIYANDKFCEIIEYSKEEIMGKKCNSFRDEKHRILKDCEKVQNELKNKRSVTKLLTSITKSNKKVYMITFFYPLLDLDSNVVEHLQIMHDVTEIVNLTEEIEETQKEVVLTMGAIGETRSKETGLHVKRVAEYSYLLANLLELGEEKANLIKQASPMHDIGKVGIPDSILKKPGKLTHDEFEIMKSHTQMGYEMLKYSKREILKTAAIISYTHHEKYDGSGYPNGISGEDIPIEGRITAVADVFDALGHDRCYKKAWELEAILKLFEEEKGKHFDPKLIQLFQENLEHFLEIMDKMIDK